MACEHVFDGEDLQSWKDGIGEGWGVIEACRCGFFLHGLAGGFEGDEDADLGFFAVEYAAQVAHVAVLGVAAFYAEDDLF